MAEKCHCEETDLRPGGCDVGLKGVVASIEHYQVERCDACALFETDEAARAHFRAVLAGHDANMKALERCAGELMVIAERLLLPAGRNHPEGITKADAAAWARELAKVVRERVKAMREREEVNA